MNICNYLNYSGFFFLAMVAHTGLTAMDLSYLQQLKNTQKKPVYGKLFIDPTENLLRYPHHICKSNHPVEYLDTEKRKLYPHAKEFREVPLNTPFIHIVITSEEDSATQTFTVIPAHKLINCTDGSIIDIASDKCTFQLTCAKSKKLAINPQYFPKEKQGNTFETQFLSCMNQFYAQLPYCQSNHNIEELVQNKVVHDNPIPLTRGLSVISLHNYTHGILHGCQTEQKFIKLATARKIDPYDGSSFNFVTNRQYSSPHAQPFIRAAQKQTKKYRSECLETIETTGNKSPMPKTIHYSKDPSLDVSKKIAPAADAALDQPGLLDRILEDCLAEFAAQQTTVATAPHPAQPSPNKTGDCSIL